MDIKKRLDEIWGADYLNALSPEAKTVLERGYVFYNNEERKDLLITGINPSFREEESKGRLGFNTTKLLEREAKHDVYWSPIRKMLNSANRLPRHFLLPRKGTGFPQEGTTQPAGRH